MRRHAYFILIVLLSGSPAAPQQSNPATGFYFYRDPPSEVVVHRDGRNVYSALVSINGVSIRCVIDTGASMITLGLLAAEVVGFEITDISFRARARTAGGVIDVAPVILRSIEIGPFLDEDVPAVVADNDTVGCLLGLPYLDRFEMSVDIDQLVLRRR